MTPKAPCRLRAILRPQILGPRNRPDEDLIAFSPQKPDSPGDDGFDAIRNPHWLGTGAVVGAGSTAGTGGAAGSMTMVSISSPMSKLPPFYRPRMIPSSGCDDSPAEASSDRSQALDGKRMSNDTRTSWSCEESQTCRPGAPHQTRWRRATRSQELICGFVRGRTRSTVQTSEHD